MIVLVLLVPVVFAAWVTWLVFVPECRRYLNTFRAWKAGE